MKLDTEKELRTNRLISSRDLELQKEIQIPGVNEIIMAFKNRGMQFDSFSNFSVKGQKAQLIEGVRDLFKRFNNGNI